MIRKVHVAGPVRQCTTGTEAGRAELRLAAQLGCSCSARSPVQLDHVHGMLACQYVPHIAICVSRRLGGLAVTASGHCNV